MMYPIHPHAQQHADRRHDDEHRREQRDCGPSALRRQHRESSLATGLAMPISMTRRRDPGKGVRLVSLLLSPAGPSVRSTSISNPCVLRGRTACPEILAGRQARARPCIRSHACRRLAGSMAPLAPASLGSGYACRMLLAPTACPAWTVLAAPGFKSEAYCGIRGVGWRRRPGHHRHVIPCRRAACGFGQSPPSSPAAGLGHRADGYLPPPPAQTGK